MITSYFIYIYIYIFFLAISRANLYHLYQSFESRDITDGFRVHISPVRQKTAWALTVSQWGIVFCEPRRASWWQTASDSCENSRDVVTDTRQLVRHSRHADLRSRFFSGTVCRCEDALSAPERSSSIKRRVISVSVDTAHVTRGSWAARRWDVQPISCSVRTSASEALADRDYLLIKSCNVSGYIFVSNRDII